MSYYFHFNAASKEEAKAKASAEMERVVSAQPIHRNDQKQALAAAGAFIDLCPEPGDGQVVYLTMSGSVSWRGDEAAADITGAGCQVTAGVGEAPRQQRPQQQ